MPFSLSLWWNRKPLKLNIKGPGAWVQKTSINNPWIFNPYIRWFVCDSPILKEVVAKAEGRPVYLATSTRRPDSFIEKATSSKLLISGLIWDYELGSTVEEAKYDLGKVYAFAKSNGLPFGVAALVVPSGSLSKNGVDYAEAKSYCDFLMPMLYSAWHSHNPKQTLNKYKTALKASSVPLLPIIAYKTSSEKIAPEQATLTSQRLTDNYTQLSLDTVCVWGCENAGQRFWTTLHEIIK